MMPLGIMDPNSGVGHGKDVTALDLAAFDAIGWDAAVDVLADPGYAMTTAAVFSRFSAAVPEPSSWSLMILGFAATGCVARRARRSGAAAPT